MKPDDAPAPQGDETRCTATAKSTGKCCAKRPVLGATVCAKHGGSAPQVKRKARERVERAAAEQALGTFGLPRTVDPHTALLEELHRTAGHVAWLGDVVQGIEKDSLWSYVGGGNEGIPEAKRSIWVQLHQDERAHLTKVAEACIKAGIEERRIPLAEAAGRQLASVIRAIVGRLGVADHPDPPNLLREEPGKMTLETG